MFEVEELDKSKVFGEQGDTEQWRNGKKGTVNSRKAGRVHTRQH